MHHHFKPSRYFNTFGPHPPALRIQPGDTVSTTSLDSTGHDGSGEQVGTTGNPVTGPFYIEGTEPGDVLIVRLDSITPNRSRSYSGCGLAANVLEPDYFPERQRFYEHAIWIIDTERLSATLEHPKVCLEPFTLELEPMLGSIGVAPPLGQALSTGTSGRHGGNMDYRGIVSGVTLYFPVFAAGGLFGFGDGHAWQADGEVLGRGLEVSMDVTFTVDLIKNGGARWPRGENETEIFTIGNSRLLEQALQHATTEMIHWLQQDFQMDELSAHMIIGHLVRYEVANVFNAAYTMVCKLDKEFLPQR